MSQGNELDESVEFGEYQTAPQTVSQCAGCREGALNQQGHMDYGGCLYLEDAEEKEEVIETQSHTGTVAESEEDEIEATELEEGEEA